MSSTPVSTLGRLLRQWRQARGKSQLELASSARISSKHLSFVETGRAQPGRDVVLRLTTALDLPLRDRNAALTAAGYAPIYTAASLASPEMGSVARAIDFILRQQEPYPAMVIGRLGSVLRLNAGSERFLRHFLGPQPACLSINLFRLLLDPALLRPYVTNFEEAARLVVLRLRREVAATPESTDAARVLQDILALPGLPDDCHDVLPEASAPPVVPTEFRKDGVAVRMFNTITTLGTPQDVTLQELRIECSFPADAESDAFLRGLAETDAAGLACPTLPRTALR